MKETKKVLKFFTPDNYEKEEMFLREMSLKGWHFDSFTLYSYKFVKGESKAYSYKLDFKKNPNEDRDNYISMIEDCGWEHIFQFKYSNSAWEYFRKETDYGTDDELFSDNESKIDMLHRVRIAYIIIFFILVSINTPSLFNVFVFGISPVKVFAILIWLFLLIVYAKMFIRLSIKIAQLKR